MTTSTPFRDLLHAANLRHGTDGFTSPPKEGVLRIFSPLKIRRLRPGLNPRTWVLKASTPPLDHRSRYIYICCAFVGLDNKKNSAIYVSWANVALGCGMDSDFKGHSEVNGQGRHFHVFGCCKKSKFSWIVGISLASQEGYEKKKEFMKKTVGKV